MRSSITLGQTCVMTACAFRGLLGLLAVVVLVLGTGETGGTADGLDQLYQRAQQEGKVVFWGPTDPGQIAPVIAAFQKKFPGIQVEHFEIQVGSATQRFVAEAQVGKTPEADIFELGPREVILLGEERGLLQKHDDFPALFGLPPEHVYGGGMGVRYQDLPNIVSAHTGLLKESEYPKQWEDLLDPKWKGKIVLEQRVWAIGGLGLVKGKDWLRKFARGLKEQQPIYVRGGTTCFNQMLAGQAPLCIGTYLHRVIGGQKKGAPAALVPLSPMLVTPRVVSIHAKAKHPNAGKLFAGWVSTPEAQKILEQASSRASAAPGAGTEAAKILKKTGVKLIVDNNEIALERVELEKLVQRILGIRR